MHLRRAFSLQGVGFIFITADAKSEGCTGGGSPLSLEKLTEGKMAAVFASLGLQLSSLLRDTFTQI